MFKDEKSFLDNYKTESKIETNDECALTNEQKERFQKFVQKTHKTNTKVASIILGIMGALYCLGGIIALSSAPNFVDNTDLLICGFVFLLLGVLLGVIAIVCATQINAKPKNVENHILFLQKQSQNSPYLSFVVNEIAILSQKVEELEKEISRLKDK